MRYRSLKLVLMLLLCVGSCFTQAFAQAAPEAGAIVASATGTLAPVPPMGWASWNHFFCDYNEQTIREQAQALVSSGMRDVGYKYVVIQECIARDRTPGGELIVDRERFPNGMPQLVDYIHHLGLRAGIYTDIGKHTCYPNPRYQGSYGHEDQDAKTFAAWGIDFVEMDYCNREAEHTGRWVYERMANAIKATGRPMIFYLCAWGNEQPWEWALGYAQMWRTEYDVSLEKNHVEWSRMWRNFESNTIHSVLSGPESWNDADMLEVGNPGLDDKEAEAQMSMWAISPSPLLAGADLVHMSARTQAIYTNREMLALNQDALGAGAEKLKDEGPGVEVWTKALGSRTSGDVAVLLLNASDANHTMNVSWSELDLKEGAKARDVWAHTSVGNSHGFNAVLPPHSTRLLRISGIRSWHRSVQYEAEWPGISREGAASLLTCGECSRGYAIALGGDGAQGSLTLGNVTSIKGGKYTVRLIYTRNGLENKTFTIKVNDDKVNVPAIMRSWNWVDIPVILQAGANRLSVEYRGKQPFNVDSIGIMLGHVVQ